MDEYSRECLAIQVARRLKSQNVLDTLYFLLCERGVPDHIRSDNGPEFTAQAVREWLEKVGVKTLFIEPSSPWENGYIESFNGRLRDELLNRDLRYSSGGGSADRKLAEGVQRGSSPQCFGLWPACPSSCHPTANRQE